MPTECSPDLVSFAPVAGRRVVAAFDGGAITSDAGALLPGAADRAIRLVERFAACFDDGRASTDRVERRIETLVGRRVFGIALGYEDVVDHDRLPRHDPIPAVLAGKLAARRRAGGAPLAGKSTLNRLEHAPPAAGPTRYHGIGHDAAARSSGRSSRAVPRRPRHGARADRPRPRRHRRPAAWPPGGAVLPWLLLRLLLLPAAVRVPRSAPARGQAAARRHRCLGRRR
jgi:Transposase DDE domain group 1